jgi:hypothetical protein
MYLKHCRYLHYVYITGIPPAARLLKLQARIPPEQGYLSLVIVVCCQVEVSATGRSLVHRSPTEWCVCVCVRACACVSEWLSVIGSTKPSTPTMIRENRSTLATSPHHRLQAVGPFPPKYSSRPMGKTSQIQWDFRQEKTFPPGLLVSTQPSSMPVSVLGASSYIAVVNKFPYRQMCACPLFCRQQAVLV